MTSVFIVTSGEYSSYQIHRVFLNEIIAESFSKTIRGSQVEEWEVDDDKDLGLYRTVTVVLDYAREGYRSVEINIGNHNVLFRDGLGVEKSLYINNLKGKDNPREYLSITRIIPNGKTDEEIQKRYERVIDDLYAQIHSLKDVEGWSYEMVNEWLVDKGRWILDDPQFEP